jgi:hypothetical protein
MSTTTLTKRSAGQETLNGSLLESAQRRSIGTQIWALLGAAQLVLIVVMVYRWWASGHMKRTPTGPDVASNYVQWFAHAFDIVSPILGMVVLYHFCIKPWRREGRITGDGIMSLALLTLYIPWDVGLNIVAPVFQYNSYSFNRGSWLADFPLTTMPHANLIPEPILVAWPSYAWGMMLPMVVGCWAVRRLKARWPNRGYVPIFTVLFVGFVLFDSFEILILQSRWMQYGAVVKEFSLFSSQNWRLPVYEAVFYALFLVVGTAFRYFRDDKGHTVVERGVDGLQTRHKSAVRFLATTGFCVVLLNFTYNIPHVVMSMHANSFPADSPSYLTNGACGVGTDVQCPGPGTPLPRTNP